MEYITGEPHADPREIIEAGFYDLDHIAKLNHVSGWTRAIINTIHHSTGLKNNAYNPLRLSNDVKCW
jgi:hypothetical protein